jgi:hypothetical protein
VDEALEKIRSEADERLPQELKPGSAEEAGTTFRGDFGDAPVTETAAFVAEIIAVARSRWQTERIRSAAVDVTVARFHPEESTPWPQFVPVDLRTRIAESISAVARLVADVDSEALSRIGEGASHVVENRAATLAALLALSATAAIAPRPRFLAALSQGKPRFSNEGAGARSRPTVPAPPRD